MKTKNIPLTIKLRAEILKNILDGLFKPRVKEIKAAREKWAQDLADCKDPYFVALLQDKMIRPYLSYSNANTLSVNVPISTRGKLNEEAACYTLRTPKLVQRTSGGYWRSELLALNDRNTKYDDRPEEIHITSHERTVTVILNDQQCAEYWAMQDQNAELLGDFERIGGAISAALAAKKTVAAFYEEFPQFKALAKVAETEEIPAPLPVPTASSLLNMVASAGIELPAVEQAQPQ